MGALLVSLEVSNVSTAAYLSGAIFLWAREECITEKSRKLFVCQKKFMMGPFGVSESLWYPKIMRKWGLTMFHQFFFVWRYRSISQGKFSVFLKVCDFEKFWAYEGYNGFSSRVFFVTVPKVFGDGIFWCLCVLSCAWHRLYSHASNNYAWEIN